MVLTISRESRSQNFHAEQDGTSDTSRHGTGPTLRQLVLNLITKDKYKELKNSEMEVTNNFVTKHYTSYTENLPIVETA